MNKKIASAEFPEESPLVYFAHLTVKIIIGWFKKFDHLLVENDPRSFQDRDYLAFTIWKDIDSGSYKIVLGIFDNKNQKVCDARVIQAGSIDPKIKQAHSNGRVEVAIWQ